MKFLFVYENINMLGEYKEKKSSPMLCYLIHSGFDFCYENYSQHGIFSKTASNWMSVRASLSR